MGEGGKEERKVASVLLALLPLLACGVRPLITNRALMCTAPLFLISYLRLHACLTSGCANLTLWTNPCSILFPVIQVLNTASLSRHRLVPNPQVALHQGVRQGRAGMCELFAVPVAHLCDKVCLV